MDKFFEMLEKIKNQPGMYLGKKDLDKLSDFISCYILTVRERTGEQIPFIHQFSIYINHEYQPKWDQIKWWSATILENQSQEDAFELFYFHLENFKKVIGTPGLLQIMEKENLNRNRLEFEQWKLELREEDCKNK
jgi:hypothetical protein